MQLGMALRPGAYEDYSPDFRMVTKKKVMVGVLVLDYCCPSLTDTVWTLKSCIRKAGTHVGWLDHDGAWKGREYRCVQDMPKKTCVKSRHKCKNVICVDLDLNIASSHKPFVLFLYSFSCPCTFILTFNHYPTPLKHQNQ